MPFRIFPLAVAIVLSVALPDAARACSCAVSFLPGEPAPTPPASAGRPVVFIGNAIEVGTPIDSLRRYVVRFVPELSWRGAMPDTVSLLVTEAPCAVFFTGLRYVVAAAPDSASPGRLRTARCDEAMRLGDPWADALLDSLGAPSWRAPPIDRREIGRQAVPLGAPLPRTPFPGAISFYPTPRDNVASFAIGDLLVYGSRSDSPAMRVPQGVYLEPGKLYRYRVTWTNGAVYESVIVGRCGPWIAWEDSCAAGILLSALAPAP